MHTTTQKSISRLTGNERKALGMLLKNGRTSDVQLATALRTSPQAASKIRIKLERLGVIQAYRVGINYAALGITTFSLVLLTLPPVLPHHLTQYFAKRALGLYRILTNEATHLALFAFNDLEEMDRYFTHLHEQHSECATVEALHVFPLSSFIKHSHQDLFHTVVKEFGKEQLPSLPTVSPSPRKPSVRKSTISTNERKVLKNLLLNGRSSYKKLAQALGNNILTSRGISKIKHRLEDKGIVEGYSIFLDYEKLGITTFAFIFLNAGASAMQRAMIRSSYNVIGCYKLNNAAHHVLFCGFRSITELEHYCHVLQTSSLRCHIDKVLLTSPKGILSEECTKTLARFL